MKIDLKNLYSERTYDNFFFDADLWINDKQAGYVTFIIGASVTIRATSSLGADLIAAADSYCKMLPPIEVETREGKIKKVNMDLKNYIMEAVVKEHVRKEMAQKPKPKIQPRKGKGRSR